MDEYPQPSSKKNYIIYLGKDGNFPNHLHEVTNFWFIIFWIKIKKNFTDLLVEIIFNIETWNGFKKFHELLSGTFDKLT